MVGNLVFLHTNLSCLLWIIQTHTLGYTKLKLLLLVLNYILLAMQCACLYISIFYNKSTMGESIPPKEKFNVYCWKWKKPNIPENKAQDEEKYLYTELWISGFWFLTFNLFTRITVKSSLKFWGSSSKLQNPMVSTMLKD